MENESAFGAKMNIKKIELHHFRNYEHLQLNLNKGINIFYGNNAQGKTNILEAIFLCSIGRSFRTNKEKELIQFGSDFASVSVDFEKKDREGNVKYTINPKKSFFVNGVKVKRLSDLIGTINTVIFTPDDINTLKDGPAVRRKFLDIYISQLRPAYLYNLNLYLKTIEQRNNYLRLPDRKEEMLEIWDEKLAEYAEKVFLYRREYIEKIKPKLQDIHEKITEGKEKISIIYHSDFQDRNQFQTCLKDHRKIDFIKGFTTKGVHRDDFDVLINENPVHIYGSQGQHRTAMLSLKMAELGVIYDEIGEYPILLLDDFMSELDYKRRKNFLDHIGEAQVIITGTEKMELKNLDCSLFQVKKGEIE